MDISMNTALVIMAAGLGSRYGGVKQIEKVGPGGEILMEYAIYDALRAGFDKLIIIIKRNMLDDCQELFGSRIERRTGMKIHYAFQESEGMWGEIPIPTGRTKPLGTVHALLSAKELIDRPFVVINADDYYGPEAFRVMEPQLHCFSGAGESAMVAYRLKNTVSPYGSVTRGVCRVENGQLRKITETYKIRLLPDGSIRDCSSGDNGPELAPDTPVSMNMWGYHPDVLPVMEGRLVSFLQNLAPDDNKSECLLPIIMDSFLAEGIIETSALQKEDQWFGLTYQEDKPGVRSALSELHSAGLYPPSLWV